MTNDYAYDFMSYENYWDIGQEQPEGCKSQFEKITMVRTDFRVNLFHTSCPPYLVHWVGNTVYSESFSSLGWTIFSW